MSTEPDRQRLVDAQDGWAGNTQGAGVGHAARVLGADFQAAGCDAHRTDLPADSRDRHRHRAGVHDGCDQETGPKRSNHRRAHRELQTG